MDVVVKQEISEPIAYQLIPADVAAATTCSDSGDGSNSDDSGDFGPSKKKQKLQVVLPVGFLDPLSPEERLALNKPELNIQTSSSHKNNVTTLAIRDDDAILFGDGKITGLGIQSCRQFWKAANCLDEESTSGYDSTSHLAVMDHVRVHPRFLHSNATSHKWTLGAFVELLDNALDEGRRPSHSKVAAAHT